MNRLSAILDYVASDYAGAVGDGQVIAAAEYQEQRGLLEEARSLLPSTGGDAATHAALTQSVEGLIADYRNRVSEAQLGADCRATQALLFDAFGLAIGPVATPSRERADALFAANCAICHGADGRAQTERARALTPPPVSFFDAERMSRLTPRVVYQALTYGVPNTGMASFEALSEEDRWSLAFEVIAWRHQDVRAESAPLPVVVTRTRLAELSDLELAERLRASEAPAVIAWLRTQVSFEPEARGPFAEARGLVARGDLPAARERLGRTLWRLRFADRRLASLLDQALVEEAPVRVLQCLDRAEEGLRRGTAPGALIASALAALGMLGVGAAIWRRR